MSELINRDEALKALCYFCHGRCKAENTNGKNVIRCSQWIALNSMMLAAETTVDWISVKDRLPRSREVVITCNKYGNMETAVCIAGEFLYYDEEGCPCYLKGITHWMPLPELTEGDTE